MILRNFRVLDCLKANIYTDKAMPVITEERETILLIKKITNQVITLKANITFNPPILIARPNKTPKVVAMPLPPLNFKNTVQL